MKTSGGTVPSSIVSNNTGDQEKGFSLLRLDTIQLWSWLEGNQPLDELSLKSLSEDISYRIRETTDVCLSLNKKKILSKYEKRFFNF